MGALGVEGCFAESCAFWPTEPVFGVLRESLVGVLGVPVFPAAGEGAMAVVDLKDSGVECLERLAGGVTFLSGVGGKL